VKAETADQHYGLDLAVYYIDWSNIAILASQSGFTFYANAAGGATVEGSELTLTARPVRNFTVLGAFAYQHAYVNHAEAALGASQRERLPNVPRFTAALNVDYAISGPAWRPTVGTTLRYVSDRMASFDNNVSYPQYQLPAYTAIDLRAGAMFDRATIQLYVHNLFNERGQLSDAVPLDTARISLLQPRTIGISVTTRF